jgi:23S rRNA (adenine2503-C2)-methyltransferase
VALAYLLVADANESDAELDAFVAGFARFGLTVHLYAFNAVPTNEHRAVTRARYEAVYERLRVQGLQVRMSSQARVEANGGCGTLVALKRNAPLPPR